MVKLDLGWALVTNNNPVKTGELVFSVRMDEILWNGE